MLQVQVEDHQVLGLRVHRLLPEKKKLTVCNKTLKMMMMKKKKWKKMMKMKICTWSWRKTKEPVMLLVHFLFFIALYF